MDYIVSLATDPAAWIALATLTTMEVVLGVDNLIFISVLSNKLPEHLRSKARRIGIAAALVLRLGLLATIALIVKLTTPLFELFGQPFSWRDLIFSLDSIITAVGMTTHIPIMVVAVVIAVATMLLAADPLAKFVHANPTILMLALAFLLLIGTTLIADGFGASVPKGYIYAAMAFSALVEGLNMMARRARRLKSSEKNAAP